MREARVKVGATEWNVAVAPGHGPPLLLLHGVTRRGCDFLPLLPALLLRSSVHAPDQRGHGRSARRPGGYLVTDYAADAVDYLRHALAEPTVVVGHSLGAMVAAEVAARAPELVRAVVLEDPPFEAMGAPRIQSTTYPDLFRAYRAHAGSNAPAEAIAAELAEARLHAPGQAAPVRLGDIRDPAALRFAAACLRQLDPEVLDPILAGRWLDGYDSAAIAARIEAPTLLVQADPAAGGALPDDLARAFLAGLRRGTHVRISGVGHQVHGDRPELMTRLIAHFLESLD